MAIISTKTKKNGLTKYRVRVYVDNIDGSRKQIEKTAYGSEQAKRLEMELQASNTVTNEITFQELFIRYQEAKKHEIRETSLNKLTSIVNNHVLPYYKNIKIDNINIKNLQNWKNKIANKNLSHTMNKNIYSGFRAVLEWAVKLEYLTNNPIKKIGNFKNLTEIKKDIEFYTPEEFLKFIKIAKEQASIKNDWDYYVFFNIAYYMGMRKGEIYALKWSDIDNNIIKIRRSIAQQLKGDDRETPPKNKSSIRDITIPAPLLKILAEHKKRQKCSKYFKEDWRICGGIKPIRNTTVSKKNQEYSKLAGIKTIRIHDFRHSHASLLANKGINILEISKRLGHSKIDITLNTYSHLYPKESEKAIKILNEISL